MTSLESSEDLPLFVVILFVEGTQMCGSPLLSDQDNSGLSELQTILEGLGRSLSG